MRDCYSVNNHPISAVLGYIEAGTFAIPEIQRPFVWSRTQVRDLIDSLYNGYPCGYLITWKNPDVRIKGGGKSIGKTVLIDGQQRVTALMAAISGQQVLNDDYEYVRIRIAFNPLSDDDESPFAVPDASTTKNKAWIPDISELFKPDFDAFNFVLGYVQNNPGANPSKVNQKITDLLGIKARQIGVIQISPDCTIDEVTEIFIRINSKGAVLSQADFAMSKIASDEVHGGAGLRKAIDYFCHLAVKPEFWSKISNHDQEFMGTKYAGEIEWLKNDHDDIYDPDYNDVLRVAFMHEFGRGKLADLVALLSGRDFKERTYKSNIADESFAKLTKGVERVFDKNNFTDFVLALRSAGFISSGLVSSKGALNFAYNLYLTLRRDPNIAATDVKRYVQRWYVMSVLTGRYSGSSESVMDRDMRRISENGFLQVFDEIIRGELSDAFWNVNLPQRLETTSTRTGAWLVYLAAQVKNAQNSLFSTSLKISDLLTTMGDVHHIFPKAYLTKELDATKGLYNQVANYAFVEKRINIAIGSDCPGEYFTIAKDACENGSDYFGNIHDISTLEENICGNCIPDDIFDMDADDYRRFLTERRQLMAAYIHEYFKSL